MQTRRSKSWRLVSGLAMLAGAPLVGCSDPPAAPLPIVQQQEASQQPFEYAQVELSDPKFRVDESGICWFEVKYKFVKGNVGENYLLNVNFPGTKNAGIKQMNGWQLNGPEGVIKDGIQLQEPEFSEYEFIFSEAEVPMEGYTQISNVLTGKYEKPAVKDSSN